MKCQIPGCFHQAVNEVRFEGHLYHGLHLPFSIQYCNKHTSEEVEKFKLQEIDRLLGKYTQCDSMKDAKVLIRKKSYELGKTAS